MSSDRHQHLADRLIEEAERQGEFDDLPGAGRPIPGLGGFDDPGWWARRYVERARRAEKAADVARLIDRALGTLWALPREEDVRTEVGRLNRLLDEANEGLTDSERVTALDVNDIVASWHRMARIRRPR